MKGRISTASNITTLNATVVRQTLTLDFKCDKIRNVKDSNEAKGEVCLLEKTRTEKCDNSHYKKQINAME